MNEAFLNEVWTHIKTSLYAIEDWGEWEWRGARNEIVVVREHNEESDGVPGEWYYLNRHDLKKDLRAMYDLATERMWSRSDNYFQDWSNTVVASVAAQDVSDWDDEVVNVFVQLATLGEITYG